jgi:hypothetical protein
MVDIISYSHENDHSENPTRYRQEATADTPRWAVDVQLHPEEDDMDSFWETEGSHYGSMGSSY